MRIHEFLDCNYGPDGDAQLRQRLADGADPNERSGALAETSLHVAVRRRRVSAVAILLDHGADIEARNDSGKTAFAHAVRRGFDDVEELLRKRGASTDLVVADRFALAIVNGRLDEARAILVAQPGIARTGNPEEDRLLADVAGRSAIDPVELLINAGANLEATALDGGTALHQAAWFGQPRNARILIDAGAPLNGFDNDHQSSPLHWAIHGSLYSGGAEERQEVYAALTEMLLAAGSSLHYPGQPTGADYRERMLADASPRVAEILRRAFGA